MMTLYGDPKMFLLSLWVELAKYQKGIDWLPVVMIVGLSSGLLLRLSCVAVQIL